jgi:hypothetical protein
VVVFARDSGGNERSQLFRVRPDGRDERRLAVDPEVIHRLGPLLPDGRAVLYCANARTPTDFDLFKQPVDGGEPHRVAALDGWNEVTHVTPDGSAAIVAHHRSSMDGDLLSVRLADGHLAFLTAHRGAARHLPGGVGPDGSAGGTWMTSIECQLAQGCEGDLIVIRGVGPDRALGGRNWSNYTWHGDQAPGHPWVHGLQTSDCDFNDLRYSKLIVMDGKNLVENKLTDSHWFIECMERGAKIVVIAPEYGPPSTKADYWIPIRPQTDAALWLGITKLMVDRKWYDEVCI